MRHLCAKVGKNLATRSIPALDLSHGPLRGPVPDSGQVCSDLLVDGCQALAILFAESGLLLLVDELVEALVQEDGQPLPFVVGGGHIAGVVLRYLGDVIGDYRLYLDDRPDLYDDMSRAGRSPP